MTQRINDEYQKRNGIRYQDLIDCDSEELLLYLKNTSNNMTLEDYPKCVPDHIKPISKFDFTNKDDMKLYFY